MAENTRRPVKVTDLECFAVTYKGLLVGFSKEDAIWLPKSQVYAGEIEKVGDRGHLVIPLWLAQAKDLEYEEQT